MPQRPAPGELRIVQALVNTAPAGQRADELASPGALAGWFTHWGLAADDLEIDVADLERIHEVRTALRALVAGNRSAAPPAHDAFEVLDRISSEVSLRVRFYSGAVVFEPFVEGFDRALAKIFKIVALERHTGLWRRVRLCLDESCGMAFFDRNVNEFTKWCCRRCSTRQNSRAYRRRRPDRKTY